MNNFYATFNGPEVGLTVLSPWSFLAGKEGPGTWLYKQMCQEKTRPSWMGKAK